ncbi:AAA family ATPase [Mycobacterium mantenii]|uniref:AAA+ ATPase domain-containing protein n=1 Tax=Mycobacterium mantenii TaxID=560555 RepID=A0A1A2T1U3_MYCNT|nr:AAA family ATPase [Mycobacterium mantenii]OBH43369.1 hypothetical protein A5688_12630 [Mycobacterium mantenii]OBH48906.1 hypothetical protein A5687_14920 [Mycobacterium mantenii]OBH70394.1 hypothetical protein A5683_00275 [Mycobacterium mantenii]
MTETDEWFMKLVQAPDGGRILSRSQLAGLKAPEPLIGNVLDRGTLAILYGPWGIGKSFVAIDWAACIATGRPWQGRPTEQSKVLYIAAEGVQGFDKRLSAWEKAWRYTVSDDQFDIHPGPVNLMDHAEVGELVGRIRCTTYGLIVVDTLARCTVGADENTSRDMGIAINSLDRLRRASGGGTVLAVHHPGKNSGTLRGSSAIEGAADTVYSVVKDGDGFILDRKKRKDGPVVDRHTLMLTEMNGSCIVEVSRRTTQKDGLEVIRSALGADGATKAQIKDVLMSAGWSRPGAYREIKALIKDGALTVTGDLHYLN